jgi:hypothetical protein
MTTEQASQLIALTGDLVSILSFLCGLVFAGLLAFGLSRLFQ